MDAPGFAKDAIKVAVANGSLTISGERKSEEKESDEEKDGVKWHRVERSSALQFRRTLSLPDNINIKGIESSLKDGVLAVTIPKVKPKEPEEHVVAIKD